MASGAPKLPGGKTAPEEGDTLAVTVTPEGAVRGLIFSDASGVYRRVGVRWVPVPDEGHPDVDDLEWLDVPTDYVFRYDVRRVGGAPLRREEVVEEIGANAP